MTEKFHLKWNDFQENMSNAWHTSRSSGDFADVTLVSGDGQLYPAHRFILAACSPVLRDIMTKVNHPHPLVYVHGVDSKDLVYVLDYIYQGEVRLDQDNLQDFLALAEELKLIGLTSTNENKTKMCEQKEAKVEPRDWPFSNELNGKMPPDSHIPESAEPFQHAVKWNEIETRIKGVVTKIEEEDLNIVDVKKVMRVHHESNGNFYLSIAHTRLRRSFIGQSWKEFGIMNPQFILGPKPKTFVRENSREDKGADKNIAVQCYQINLDLFEENFKRKLKALFKPHPVPLK